MNMLQRNPSDPKHEEFHDGEYEYWPQEAPLNSKSGSFPAAALINGLGLLSAALAAAVFAGILAMLLALSSAVAISKTTAKINVALYNNNDNLPASYTLARKLEPELILREGSLVSNRESLYFEGLSPGTEYIIEYFVLEEDGLKKVGEFYFKTPGDPIEQTVPTGELDLHDGTSPTEKHTDPTESTDEAAKPSDPTETTTASEEETTEASKPTDPPGGIYVPPTPKPDSPEEETEATTEATEPSTEETEPTTEETEATTEETEASSDPAAKLPEASEVTFTPGYDSGSIFDGTYHILQTHTFENAPEGVPYSVIVTVDGEEYTGTVESSVTNGILEVTVPDISVDTNVSSTTEVKVNWDNGMTATSTYSVVPPTLEGIMLEVTDNGNNSWTITVTVYSNDTDEKLAVEASLYVDGDGPVPVTMGWTEKGVYKGTHTVYQEVYSAWVDVEAVWEKVGVPSSLAQPLYGSAIY